jgi:hypothetical protein
MIKQITLVVFICGFFSISTYGQTRHDLFPLSKGNYFKYALQKESSYYDIFGDTSNYKKDIIGTSTFKIVSVVTVKDTNIWSVERYDTLHFYQYTHLNPWVLVLDSAYTGYSTFCVYEALADSHKISLSDHNDIWNLPVDFHRYATVEYVYNRNTFHFTTGWYEWDTLICKKNLGLSRMHYEVDNGIDVVGVSTTSAQLIESLILASPAESLKKTSYALHQNYPNPFNPSTKITYSIGSTQLVTVKIYNVLGKLITTLVNEEKPAGNYQVQWNAGSLPSGIYFCEMKSGNFKSVNKMLLMK